MIQLPLCLAGTFLAQGVSAMTTLVYMSDSNFVNVTSYEIKDLHDELLVHISDVLSSLTCHPDVYCDEPNISISFHDDALNVKCLFNQNFKDTSDIFTKGQQHFQTILSVYMNDMVSSLYTNISIGSVTIEINGSAYTAGIFNCQEGMEFDESRSVCSKRIIMQFFSQQMIHY